MFAHHLSMKWKFSLTWSVVLMVVTACENEPGRLGLGNSVFDNNYSVVLVDTIKVEASTVLLDSIPTSGTGSILIGGYSDPKLGVLSAEGYIQLSNGAAWAPPDHALFDSLVLTLNYSGYSYGDTTQAQTFVARRITQAFKTYNLPQFWVDEKQYSVLYQQSSLYNSSAIRYDVSTLGTKTFHPRPNSIDSLTIRLNDDLGKEWLNLAKDQSVNITQTDKFLEYFKGVFISASSPSEAVVGFNTADAKIRLYYKEYSDETLVQRFHEFPIGTILPYYSKVHSDRSGTILESLTNESDEISCNKSDDQVFIQSGTGIVVKVTFPYIRKMIDLQDILLVNEAQLILEPAKNSYDGTFSLPESLTLFETDKSNLPLKQLLADYNATEKQKATISIDNEFNKTSGYVFTITEYMQGMLSSEGNLQKGLLIMLPSDEIGRRVERTYVNAGNGSENRIRLKVWYTRRG